MCKGLATLCIFFIQLSVFYGQWDYGFKMSVIPVVTDGDTLANPWTGGLTAPQWSPIDLDFDGDEDLFCFDRDGHRLLAFERTSEGGWHYRPEWVEGWPEITEWCLLRDFNCDGKPDIFTSYQNYIYVYLNNTTNPLNPEFEPVATPLNASYDFGQGPDMLPVVCLSLDIPAIQDLDGDGDLDIITFTETSATLYKYEGLSACGLEMECTNRCYGMLAEAMENNNLYIGEDFDCEYNVADPRSDMRHAGGSLTALQLDDNGPLDLLIGDVTYPSIIGVILEDADDGQDSAIFTDFNFPLETNGIEALDCQRFPSGYHIDVDDDGARDLLFSPNTYLEIDDDACVHYMRNIGTDLGPVWNYVSSTYMQDGMIDMGRGAYPVLKDVDGDSLIDLVVTNKENYQGLGSTPTKLHIYKNTGTETDPVFTLPDSPSVDLSTYGIESAFPAVGDVDGDGDIDLIIGDELGLLHYFENNEGEGNWPLFEATSLSISDATDETIDVGQFATPQLVDINSDGLLDMVIGEKNGILNLYLNCGSSTSPEWCKYTSDEFGYAWGNIHVTNALGINGYSTPSITQDSLGTHILVSNEVGSVQYFGLLEDDLNHEYSEETVNVLNHVSGYRTASTFSDLNDDGKLDCLIGLQNGGMRCYMGSDSVTIDVVDNLQPEPISFNIYPNPGGSILNWSSSLEDSKVEIYTTTGIKILSTSDKVINTEGFASGIYLVVQTKTGSPQGPPALWMKLDN
ncbi:MAG: hypothetical protein CL823_00660 [Crocinitomicaceae bacterium]|nr:hypothetical protein [Crocinitomicaceae bacterium]